jgi:hypothetical protein
MEGSSLNSSGKNKFEQCLIRQTYSELGVDPSRLVCVVSEYEALDKRPP